MTGLSDIYGAGAVAQEARYQQALADFNTVYGPGPVSIFRAPGRVNLIGEHTDYNHGYVMPLALDRDTLLLLRPRADAVIRLHNQEPEYPPAVFTAGPDIPSAPRGHWSNYARAAAQALARRSGRTLTGLDGLVVGAPPYGVPRGAGLSSSSALTVVVAVALAHINGALPAGPARADFARFCSEAEWYVGTRGGIMDHFAALLCLRDHALFLDCRPAAGGDFRTAAVPLPAGYRLLVVDSGIRHQNTGGQFNERVAACRAGVGLLRAAYSGITHLRDVQDVPWAELETRLPEAVTPADLRRAGIALEDLPGLNEQAPLRVRARCRHVWNENRRVLAAAAALRRGDIQALGCLLNEAHASAANDYEISCPEIESLVRAARAVEGVAGARLTGAGWGGCIVALVAEQSVPQFEESVRGRYRAEMGRAANIFACRAGPGAGMVTL